jgi:cytochrome c peroxidase
VVETNSDMILVQDPEFRKVVELYAKNEGAFFKDFASAFSKLLELGVDFPSTKAWYQFW